MTINNNNMPTASITLTSTDIAGDPVNISRSSTCYKAGTETPLDQTAGLNKLILTTTTNKELYIATAAGDNKAAKMYICNKSETPSEYVTITINAQDIGKLYAGDPNNQAKEDARRRTKRPQRSTKPYPSISRNNNDSI